MQEKDKKEFISPQKPEDLLTCTAFLTRELVSQYLALGIISKTKAVALYITSGIIEFRRKGCEFWERPGTIAKALKISRDDVKTYIKRLKKGKVIAREVKEGDPEKKRIWVVPNLEMIINENANSVSVEGGTTCTLKGGQSVAPKGTACTPPKGTDCPLHLNETDLELIKGVKQVEVKVGASPRNPPEPDLPITIISFKKEAGEKSLDRVDTSTDLIPPKDLYDPRGLIEFYRRVLTENGRKLPPRHSTALDLKVAGAMLEVLPHGLKSPEVFAESIRAYLSQVPTDDPHGLLLSHFSAWIENGGADEIISAHESAMQEAEKAQEAEKEAKYRKQILNAIQASSSATRIMDAIVEAHGEDEAIWDEEIYSNLEEMAEDISPEDADEIIRHIKGRELRFVSMEILKATMAVCNRKKSDA